MPPSVLVSGWWSMGGRAVYAFDLLGFVPMVMLATTLLVAHHDGGRDLVGGDRPARQVAGLSL
jgi:hypothetical protein